MKNLDNIHPKCSLVKIFHLKFIKNLTLGDISKLLLVSGAIILNALLIVIAYSHGAIQGTACLGIVLLVWGLILGAIHLMFYC